MIKFFKSMEFWIATWLLILAVCFGQFGNLANVVQNSGVYGWAYVIWRMEKHHELIKKMVE